MFAALLLSVLSLTAAAQTRGRAAEGGVPVVPVAAPPVSPAASAPAPTLSGPSLAAPVLPSAVVPVTPSAVKAAGAQAAAPLAQAAATRALAAPAAAAASAVLPEKKAAPVLLGADGKPLIPAKAEALIVPGAERGGRAAPELPPLDALFDGRLAERDGESLLGRLSVAGRPDAVSVARAKAELAVAVARGRGTAAEAAAARTFQGRSMTLDEPCCGVAAPVLGALLRRDGLPVDVVQAEFHTFLVREAGGELIVIDPTVRQFFGGRRAPADIPTVFIGTLGELEALFARRAAAKTTRYDVRRIYFSEAVVKNALLGEAVAAASAAETERGPVSPARAVENATYRPLANALRRPGNANPAKEVEPEAPKPSESKGWLARLKDFLFPAPAADPAWDAALEVLRPELDRLAALPKAERAAYLRRAGDGIVASIKARHGTEEIGFHYNLHGGRPEQYVAAGGIRATMGDIALQYTMNGDRSYKVYFFRSANANLYDLLSERHPNLVSSRMGDVLILFRLDSKFMKDALASGLARNPGAISVDFDETRLPRMIGVPADTFLAPPLLVFRGAARRVGRRLSRDEETLAVMRYIEAALVPRDDGRYVTVGRSRVDRSAPAAKELLKAYGSTGEKPLLGLMKRSSEELVSFAALGDGALGHRDLLPPGEDASDLIGFTLFLKPDGSHVLLGSGGFPGAITPRLERRILAAAGIVNSR